jgi:hypothetical protein
MAIGPIPVYDFRSRKMLGKAHGWGGIKALLFAKHKNREPSYYKIIMIQHVNDPSNNYDLIMDAADGEFIGCLYDQPPRALNSFVCEDPFKFI